MSNETVVVEVEPNVINVQIIPDSPLVVQIGAGGGSGGGGVSRTIKAGVVAGASFSGSPKKAVVIFDTPYDDDTYVIILSGTDPRTYTYEAKSASGFTINANAAAVIAGEVSWDTTTAGEST